MAETVDTRVVEAKFDSSQFEKGVDKTVKKLDELKKSLELKDTGKTVAEFASKTQEATEKASNSLEKLNDRFTSFTGMLKQKFISGIADEVVGAFFKMKQSFESFVSSLSTGQIGQGMQRYTDILTSVRTMTAAGVNQDSAYEAIDRLGTFADQTSYSLDELVSTMSKFKTAGASLDTARRMVEGLSNAAASMGVNAQQAGRAYLNMQQAYSKGVMLQNDWMSFESLPMVGEKFNQKILEAAESVGTLKKEANGTYTAVAKVIKQTGGGKGSTGGELGKGITAQNMGSKLGSRFFTKAVMEKVFGESYYFAAIDPDELKPIKQFYTDLQKQVKAGTKTQEKMNEEFDEFLEEKKLERHNEKVEELNELLEQNAITQAEYNVQLEKFDKENILTREGYEFFVAGQEARSFNDVLNTLKDTISRGWAKSFEFLFGKLDEAADFFTWLAESKIANAIYAIGDFRNSILEIWHGEEGDPNSGFGMLRTALENIDEIIGNILGHFTIFSEDEDKIGASTSRLGNKLIDATQRFKDFTFNLKTWLESTDKNGVTRYQRIGDVITTFSNIVTTAFGAINLALHGVQDADGKKKFAGLLDILSTLEPVLVSLWGIIEKVVQPIQKLFDPAPDENGQQNAAYKGLQDSLNNLYKLSEKVMPVLASVLDVIGDVAAFFVGMSMDTISMNIQFFSDVFGFLMELIFGTSSQKENSTGVIEGINNDIATLGQTCKDALGSIKDFFAALFEDIKKILGISEDNQNGNVFENIKKWFDTNEFVQSVKTWIDNAIKDVGDFILNIPTRISEFFKNMFYTPVTVPGAGTIWMKKPLTQWLENAGAAVWKFITVDIPDFVKGIPSIISEFIHGLFYKKETDPKTGKEVEVETPLKQWFENAKNTIWNFLTVDIPNFVKSIPSLVGSFIHSLFYKKEKDPKTGEEVEVKTAVKEWFDKAIEDVKAFVKDIPNKAKKLGISIGDFFKGIFYYKTSVGNTGKVTWVKKPITLWLENAMKTIGTAIGEFVKNIPSYISTAIDFTGNLLRSIVGALFGKKDGSAATNKDAEEELKKPFEGINFTSIIATIKGIGKKVVNNLTSIFTGSEDWQTNKNFLAEGVANGISWIKEKADEVWTKVTDWIAGLPDTIAKLFEGGSEDADGEGSPIAKAILGFAESVGIWISKIPDKLLTAWQGAEKIVGNLWNKIVGWILGDDSANELTGKYQERFTAFLNSNKQGKMDISEEINAYKNSLLNEQWRENNPIAANISDFFTRFISYLGEKIEALPGAISEAWNIVTQVYEAIRDVIFGKTDEEKKETNPIYKKTTDLFEDVWKWINEKVKWLGDEIGKGFTVAVDIAKIIGNVLFGNNNKPIFDQDVYDKLSLNKSMAELYKRNTVDYGSPMYNSIARFFDNVKDWVIEEAGKLGGKIKSAWNTAIDIGTILVDVLFGDTSKPIFDQDVYDKLSLNKSMAELYKRNTRDYGSPLYNSIGEFFEGVKNWIREKIEDLPAAVSRGWEAFKNLGAKYGPVILDGLNSGLTWVKTQLGSITDWLKGPEVDEKLSIKENIDKYFEDPKNAELKPVWEKIKTLGENIGEFMFQTIPDFIREAVKKIAEEVPNILSGIFNGDLFGGLLGGNKDSKKTAEEAAKNAADPIYAMLTSAEEAVKNVSDPIRALFNFDKMTGNKTKSNEPLPYEEYLERMKKLKEEYDVTEDEIYNLVPKEDQNLGLLGMFPGANADEALTDEQLKAVEEKLKKKKEALENEEEISRLQEKINVLQSAQRRYLISGTDEFNAVQDEIDKYQAMIDKLTETGKAEKDADKKVDNQSSQDFAETAIGLVSGLGDVVNTITSSLSGETGKTVATLAAVSLVLYMIRDIFSLSDEMEALKGALITAVFGGLVALIGYITYIATMGTETQFQNVEKVFGYLEKILELIVWAAGILKVGAPAFEALNGMLTGKNKSVVKAGASTNLFGAGLVTFLTNAGDKLIDAAVTPIKISGIADVVINSIEEVFDVFADVGVRITQGIDTLLVYLDPAIEKMNELSPKLDTALAAIPKAQQFVNEFKAWFAQKWFEDRIEGVIGTNIQSNVDLFYTITTLISNMFNALGALSDIENPEAQIDKAISVISGSDGGQGFYGIFESILILLKNPYLKSLMEGAPTTTNPTNAEDVGRGVRFIADVLSIFATSLKDIPEMNLSNLNSFLVILREIINDSWLSNNTLTITNMGLQKWILGDTSLSAFGQVLSQFTAHMVSVFRSINTIKGIVSDKDITQEDVDSFKKVIGLINEYSDSLLSLAFVLNNTTENYQDSADQLFQIDNTNTLIRDYKDNKHDVFTILRELLPEMSTMVGEIITNVNNFNGFPEVNITKVKTAIESIKMLVEALSYDAFYYTLMPDNLNYVADALFGQDGKSGFMGRLQEAGVGWGRDTFGGASEFIEMLYQLSSAIKTFYEVDDEGNFNYEKGLANLAEMLTSIIALGENDWGEFKIQPVIEMSDEDKATLQTLQSLSGLTPTLTVSLANELKLPDTDYLNDKFKELNETINTMDGHLTSLRLAVNGSDLALLVYPDIVKELAYAGMLGVRGSFKD